MASHKIIMTGLLHGAWMGFAWVDNRRMDFLSFHITGAMVRESCILQNVVPFGTFLNALIFFKNEGSPVRCA